MRSAVAALVSFVVCAHGAFAASAPASGAHGSRPEDTSALPGLCAPYQGAGASVALEGLRFAPEQARDPGSAVATIDARQSMLILNGGHFLLRTSTVYAGDIEFRFRTVGSPDGEWTIDEIGWRDGDVLQADDAAASVKDYADLRMLVPGLLACDAHASPAVAAGAQLTYQDPAGRPVTLHLSSGLIQTAQVGADDYHYLDWRQTPQGPAPQVIERRRRDQLVARWTTVRTAPAQGRYEGVLTAPEGYRPADDGGTLRATPLGAGAYRVDAAPSGYHTGFVVGARAIAVFDAPVSLEAAKQVRDLVERTAPNLPIAYVVVSHVHGDHVAGLAAYADAEVIAGSGASAAIARQFGAGPAFRLHEVTTAARIDLGGRSVAVFPIDSSHASTMLVAYDPDSKALFQGDLFYLPERGATPPAFTTGLELQQLIAREKLDVRSIVGVHGRTGGMDDLAHAVGLRAARPQDRGCVGTIIGPTAQGGLTTC
ncbi:MBL fold metallo-hydrolase [Caulobacter sp. UNC358MFTsu5.1]|uniref:MBL fold metallo-hydrolase n=1 Tax=Caulobacter sp. UNC358MFTsu5.1 TaxID=1449049 RepID=UPI0012DD78F8|nr:MBL fold metallo-hydrolase [Caulobacter sp. UNC358MFTsu5.1]